ncbi:MAG: hypothetical protein FWG87_15155 [Defluviitaleaceae bacterium]|nr:hypothetical protein [Defluviitaleaceae bacterium]
MSLKEFFTQRHRGTEGTRNNRQYYAELSDFRGFYNEPIRVIRENPLNPCLITSKTEESTRFCRPRVCRASSVTAISANKTLYPNSFHATLREC